jgi:alpha-D-ribose 1-methylphosphonate 5-triphosphate synthase subunit PhnG
MDRNRRFEAIARCDETALRGLAERVLASAEVSVLRAPTPGMLMMRARERAHASLFNLGEVTVTEAEVEVAGHRGYAMTMGVTPAKALAGAIVDAGAEALGDLRPAIEAVLTRALADGAIQKAERWQRVADTRVQFDEIP